MKLIKTLAVVSTVLAAAPALADDHGKSAANTTLLSNASYSRQPFSSAEVNRALQGDPQNARLNFLNGLIYDSVSTPGAGRELARVGYEIAVQNDPSFWPAAYQLGLLAMDSRNPLLAERWLLKALAYAPQDAAVLYALARAAYCAGDVDTASSSLRSALALEPAKTGDRYLTATLVKAAIGDAAAAKLWLGLYQTTTDSIRFGQAQARTQQLLLRASFAPKPPVSTEQSAPQPTLSPPPADTTKVRTAVIDLIFLRRDAGTSSGRGVNLLDMLKLNFGSSLLNSMSDKVQDHVSGLVTSDTETTSRSMAIDVPTVTYSLNIANASGGNSSIEGHPSLLVYDGQPSALFSGNTVTYGVSGNAGGSTFTKDVGLQLSVKPQFRDNGSVNLTVTATLETFVNGGPSSFKEQITTQKDSANIVADLNFNQAMLVSAGSLRKTSDTSSQVPLLGDIPGLNLMFRRADRSDQRTDLYVLMALRKTDDDSSVVRQKLREEVDKLLVHDGQSITAAQADSVAARPVAVTETHADFYQLDNPGRRMDSAYITRLGFTPGRAIARSF